MRQTVAVLALVALCACGGGGGTKSPAAPSKSPTGVTISPAATTLIKIGEEQAYTAAVRYSDGTETPETATWQSDAPQIATIDGTGKARGVDSGEATLIARAQNITGTLKIRVVPNYHGTWEGGYTVRNCTASGAFDPDDWCGADLFHPGNSLPIELAVVQEREKLTGTLTFGTIEHSMDSGSSIRIDGGASITARGSYPAESLTVNSMVNPMSVRAQGPALRGTFTLTITVAGYPGSTIVDAELGTVTQTSGAAHPGRGGPQPMSRRELFQRFTEKP